MDSGQWTVDSRGNPTETGKLLSLFPIIIPFSHGAMNSQDPRDIDRQLEELEKQIKGTSDPQSQAKPLQELILPIQQWYQNLPQIGQIVVAGGAVLLGFSILNLFLRLVSAAIALAVMGGLLYLGYKFLIAPGPSQK